MENTQTFTPTTRKEEWKRKVGYIPRVSGEGGLTVDGRLLVGWRWCVGMSTVPQRNGLSSRPLEGRHRKNTSVGSTPVTRVS